MAKYVTPFLVFNLGSEMVYVIAQRLEAQNVAKQRAGLGSRVDHACTVHWLFLQHTALPMFGFVGKAPRLNTFFFQ